MLRKKWSNGFTMIELIVVLTIIGILAALTVPSLLGFIEDSYTKDCRSKISDVERLYVDAVIDKGIEEPQKYESFTIVDNIMKNYGAVNSDGSDIITGDEDETGTEKIKYYKGICPKGGEYIIYFKKGAHEGETKISVACTYKDHSQGEKNVSLIGIHTLSQALEDKTNKIYTYFKDRGSTSHIDSTGTVYAPEVQKMLSEIGIDITETSSWRIYKLGDKADNNGEWGFNIFWTETKIDNLPEKTEFQVLKYNTGTKKYYYGTAQVRTDTMPGTNPPVQMNVINVSNTKWTEVSY